MLRLARGALEQAIGGGGGPPPPDEPWLGEPGASFVTLRLDDRLRGCIGSIRPRQSIALDVCENARAAALEDPRFPPLAIDELHRVRIEVSLLSPLEPIEASDEAELLERLGGNRGGLYLEAGPHRATFLPQVWTSLPRPEEFVAKLKQKAGLAAGSWPDGIRWWRFAVTKWAENEARADPAA